MKIDFYLNFAIILIFGLLWGVIVLFLWRKRQKRIPYVLAFTVFYVYVVKVLDYTLFHFQSLILLKLFMPTLMLRGQTADKAINLIPILALKPDDLMTSFLNILLFVPFGFLLPFIIKIKLRKIIMIGVTTSITIELLQFLTGYFAGITFRIADVNDVIFNTIGVGIGYVVLMLFQNRLVKE